MTSPDTPADRSVPPVPAYGEYASPEDAANALRSRWPAPSGTPVPADLPLAPVAVAAPPRDRWLSIALLAFGLYSVVTTVNGIASIETALQALYTSYGLGDYAAPAGLGTAKAIGIASQVLLFVAVLLLTVRRIQRGKVSWWIPLLGGVIATVVLVVILGVVIAGDHALMDAATKALQKT